MSTIRSTWTKLSKSKQYREEFALSMLKRMIPYQIRAMRTKRNWSQEELSIQARITQGVISRAEDPNYGNLTLNTIGKIAGGFDVAAIVRFLPFSELLKLSKSQSEKEFAAMPEFQEDSEPDEEEEKQEQIVKKANPILRAVPRAAKKKHVRKSIPRETSGVRQSPIWPRLATTNQKIPGSPLGSQKSPVGSPNSLPGTSPISFPKSNLGESSKLG